MISIITPHFNDFEGLKRIYNCLRKQSSDSWEWLIVDDLSDTTTRDLIEDFFQETSDKQVQLIFNSTKTNASVCRNIGINHTIHEQLVFLDSDDLISEDFVANRLIPVEEFVVFQNYFIKNEHGVVSTSHVVISNPLDHFLRAHFIWQTTAFLWKKAFLIKIGKFDSNLERLQDVELSIRGLIFGNNYSLLDNKADFYYCVVPINMKKKPVQIVCDSVHYLISSIHDHYQLEPYQYRLLSGYYFMCVKYLHRSQLKSDIVYARQCLTLLYSKKDISFFKYLIGHILLSLYKFKLITNDIFLRINRYFFKPKLKAEH